MSSIKQRLEIKKQEIEMNQVTKRKKKKVNHQATINEW
jgi:hypothetical protein